MTWVLASPTWLGSSVCLGDIQVTAGDETFDCLRKVYGVHPNVLAGFAGNVKTGFEMLAALKQLIGNDESQPADIEMLVRGYPEVARDLFAGLPADIREGGSAVLVAGAEPAANTRYGSRSRAFRFMSPGFEPHEIPHQTWDSIGSGSDIAAYKAELEKLTDEDADGLLQMEVGQRGGHARIMAQFIAMQVAELPSVTGISQHFHIGVVLADGLKLTTSERDFFPPDGPRQQIRMPPVASSWAELGALLAGRISGELTVAIA